MSDERKIFGGNVLTKLVYDGFLKIWKATTGKYEIVEKKDAVGLLIYNRDRRQLVFVEQDRPATEGRLIEVMAGHIEKKPWGVEWLDWIKQSMAREAQEEIGANVDYSQIELAFESGIYTSPGFTTEKLWLGYLEIGDDQIEAQERTFGLAEEDEKINRIWINLFDLPTRYLRGKFRDMKTIILIQWFLRNKYPQITKLLAEEMYHV